MKRAFLVCFIVVALFSSLYAATFKDVPANHWAYEAVDQLTKLGILSGMPDGTFQGNQPLTRYQLAVALYRMLNILNDRISAVEKKLPTSTTSSQQSQQVALPANIDAQLKDISNKILELATADKNINTRIDNLIAQVNSLSSTVQDSSKQLNNLKRDLDDLKALYDALTVKVTEMRGLVSVTPTGQNLNELSKTLMM